MQRILLLLEWVRTRGKTEYLLGLLPSINPDGFAAAETGIRTATGAPAFVSAKAGEERIVREGLASVDPVAWRRGMIRAESTVCRLEYPAGTGWGTGFLVAPDLVVTCYHVLRDALGEGVLAAAVGEGRPAAGLLGDVLARFDYKVAADGVSVGGNPCRLSAAAPWCVAFSLDGNANLDYLVLRLDRPAGEDLLEDGQRRGFLTPSPEYVLKVGEPLQIHQHPKAELLRYAVGGDNLREVAFNLIRWAEAGGRLEELLRGALAQNPSNPRLKAFATSVLLTSEPAPRSGERLQTKVRAYDLGAVATLLQQALTPNELEALIFDHDADLWGNLMSVQPTKKRCGGACRRLKPIRDALPVLRGASIGDPHCQNLLVRDGRLA